MSPSKRLHGIRTTLPKKLEDVEAVRAALKQKLALDFQPDLWQVHLIQRVLKGYDTVCVAATGLGKSLIFEGTAALAGPSKVVVVICPLKALERDQVCEQCSWYIMCY